MLQNIPKGVSKITSARNLASKYKDIIEEFEKDSDSVIGVTNKNEIKFVVLSSKRYQQIIQSLNERESEYLNKLVAEGLDDYKKGRTSEVNDKWFEKMRNLD